MLYVGCWQICGVSTDIDDGGCRLAAVFCSCSAKSALFYGCLPVEVWCELLCTKVGLKVYAFGCADVGGGPLVSGGDGTLKTSARPLI